ncbi:hypothetical protein DMN91_011821 [Ooceraea biroi]|uniref:CLIP domain-containing serine protease n=1 Tax=Ooceraea biroi TaxID=2015173 RepID=A0A3L8D7J0_OOCBI|nr:hypothetical protein DMN91_011821 [Ooceraea biroi]
MTTKSTILVSLKLLTFLIISINAQYEDSRSGCRADGQMGTCKAARNCTAVATILQQSRDEAFAYLKRNHCGFDGKTPLVCCINNIITRPTPPNEDLYDRTLTNSGNSTPSEEGRIGVDNNPLLPSDCGRDLSQRIVGGERTSLDEFPWMALLEYQKPNGRTTACGGVLISKRYVLTAAHCIKGKDLPTTWRLSSVRLGEYDTDTDTDCISDGNNGTTCADDPVTVGVEEQFAHEEYQPLSRHQRYDIALLRLAQDVTFTKYIKPICLPSNSTSLDDRLFFVAGWGKTETRSSSNVKLKLSLPLVSDSQCDQTYNNAGVRLGYGQICAGGQRGKDSCRGDSGGPLMALERLSDRTGKWSAVGVVSFGPSPCGMQGWPGVYTKVQDFVPWILSKLRAVIKRRGSLRKLTCLLCEVKKEKERKKKQSQGYKIYREATQSVLPEINMRFVDVLVALVALYSTTVSAQSECTDSRATCISIRNCPAIIEVLRGPRPLSPESLQRLRNAQCGFDGNDPLVCCINQQTSPTPSPPTSPPPTPPPPRPTMESEPEVRTAPSPPDVSNHPNLRLLNQNCGCITDSRIIGGNSTSVFEFPWMALIAYDIGRPNPEFRCGGTVISPRYILTAAHCVTTLPAGLTLIGVRVGDHDISKERDCDVDQHGVEVLCAERYQDFGVESVHFHPQYTRRKLQNDIALIRVNSSIDFRPQNAKPVCLPLGTAARQTSSRGIVTGWGATELGPRSQALLKANLPLVSYEECKEIYKHTSEIWYKQMCAGGQNSVDSCMGDSGGPLQSFGTYENNPRIIQYGVVSYGLRQCGTEGFPGVYTNIVYYMDWILDTVRE